MHCIIGRRWKQFLVHSLAVALTGLVLVVPAARAQEGAGMESRASRAESEPGVKESGLIPHVLIGPRISLLALPSPSLGGEVKVLRYVGVSFDYGFLPKITVDGATVKYDMWNVAARIYPFGGAFFVGAVYGHYGVDGSSEAGKGSGTVHVASNFIGPQIGLRMVQPSGFFTGVDVAWAFPISYTSETSADASGRTLEIKQNADKYLQHGVPLLGLVSFGWLF